jgi:hypothetical protein
MATAHRTRRGAGLSAPDVALEDLSGGMYRLIAAIARLPEGRGDRRRAAHAPMSPVGSSGSEEVSNPEGASVRVCLARRLPVRMWLTDGREIPSFLAIWPSECPRRARRWISSTSSSVMHLANAATAAETASGRPRPAGSLGGDDPRASPSSRTRPRYGVTPETPVGSVLKSTFVEFSTEEPFSRSEFFAA